LTQSFTDIDNDALDALIERVTEAKDHELALSPDDCQLLLNALMTLANLQENIASKDVTIHKLKKLVGIVKSSEKLGALVNQEGLAPKGKKANTHQRTQRTKPETNKVKPKIIHHALTTLSKGELCPECSIGKLTKYEPASFLRITGQSPFVPEQHVMERLRCNACGAYFTAPLAEDVRADGNAQQKYGYSARSLMAINKYYAGTQLRSASASRDNLASLRKSRR
jgi:transposase